jgi:hypothetical protein
MSTNKMTVIQSKLMQAVLGFTSLEDYYNRLLIAPLRLLLKKAKTDALEFEYAEPEDISCIDSCSSLSVSMESEPIEDGSTPFEDNASIGDASIEDANSPLNTVQMIQRQVIQRQVIERQLQPVRVQMMKHKKKDWNKWARSNNLKDYQAFRIRYKKETCKITGMWRGDKYFLVTDLIAPIPPGREAEAAKHGWGLHIIHDCPTRVVALVKMTYGAPLINKGHGASAQPYELEMLHAHGRWAPIYKAW